MRNSGSDGAAELNKVKDFAGTAGSRNFAGLSGTGGTETENIETFAIDEQYKEAQGRPSGGAPQHEPPVNSDNPKIEGQASGQASASLRAPSAPPSGAHARRTGAGDRHNKLQEIFSNEDNRQRRV